MGTMLITQSLATSSLVAGKSTALRLFFTTPQDVASVDSIEVTVLRPDGSRVAWQGVPGLAIPHSAFDFVGPSFVTVIPGHLLPWVGTYYFRARALSSGKAVTEYTVD